MEWKKTIEEYTIYSKKKKIRIIISRNNKYKIKNILLGHHQDDLLENFFIRIFRGSGLKGLISLDKSIKIENKILLRPFLNMKKMT